MVREIKPHGPLPSQAQLAYLEDELAAFIHFGPNTFYNQEWGTGQEDPERFNPIRLDAREWVRVLKETGFRKLILVVKHHDGFVLYPTAYTDYSVKASPWRNGEGDLLLEVSQAATEFDMDMGVYLSPWDAHSPLYHVEREADYNAYYLAQLKEILSNPAYGNGGKFAEVWMDGARGEGAQKVNYEFEKWFETIHELQGDCLIFSTEGTSIRWIGNERGYAGDPLWQKVKPDQLGTEAELDYLQHGDPSGTIFQSERQMFPSGQVGFTMKSRILSLLRSWWKSTFTRWVGELHSCSIFRRIKMGYLMQRILNDFMNLRPIAMNSIKKIWLWELRYLVLLFPQTWPVTI